MACQICELRKPRRHCPGVRGDICPQCCGNERERTVDCPLDCEYLIESRRHEKHVEPDTSNLPNADVELTDNFIQSHEALIAFLAQRSLEAVLESPGIIDTDLRDAISSLIRTYRTRESGLIYETRPTNPYAFAIYERLQKSVEELQERLRQEAGMHTLRDSEVMGSLVFLERLGIRINNGRPRGKAFLSFLLESFPLREQPGLVQP